MTQEEILQELEKLIPDYDRLVTIEKEQIEKNIISEKLQKERDKFYLKIKDIADKSKDMTIIDLYVLMDMVYMKKEANK